MTGKKRNRTAPVNDRDRGWKQVIRGIAVGVACMVAGMLAMALFLWLSRTSPRSFFWCSQTVKLAAAVIGMAVSLRGCRKGRLPKALAAGGGVWGITLAAVSLISGWKWTWIMGIDLAAVAAATVALSLCAPAHGRK